MFLLLIINFNVYVLNFTVSSSQWELSPVRKMSIISDRSCILVYSYYKFIEDLVHQDNLTE